MKTKIYIKTGEGKTVDDWVRYVWPDHAKRAILTHIPDYRKRVKLRTSSGKPTISRPIDSECRIIINYNSGKDCFIVWDASVQNEIHHGKKMRLPIGEEGEKFLRGSVDPDSVKSFTRTFTRNGAKDKEKIYIIGKNAIEDFCKTYQERF